MSEPPCLRVRDVALRWDCSEGKVRSLIKSGALPCLWLGGMVRIPIANLIAFEAACQVQPVPHASAASPDACPPSYLYVLHEPHRS
jgi:hypothetical protein